MSRRTACLLGFIWVVFLVRGLFYTTVIPIWEGWDEFAHFAFVEHLENGHGLPAPAERVSFEITRSLELAPLPWALRNLPAPAVTHDDFWLLSSSDRSARAAALKESPANMQQKTGTEYLYEGKQPPLYYLLTSIVLRPFRPASLIDRVFMTRLFSVLVASSVVFLSFAAARQLFGDDRTALQIAALITAMPQLFVDIARVSNEPLSILLYSLLAYWLVLLGNGKFRYVLYAEITLGLGLLTKAYFVAAIPAVATAVVLALWRSEKPERLRHFAHIAIAGFAGLALCAWWYVLNLSVASGPIWADAAPAQLESGGGFLKTIAAIPLFHTFDFIFLSHIWMGGWSFLSLRAWIYHVFMLGFLLGLIGLAVYFRRVVRAPKAGVTATALLAILYGGFWTSHLYQSFVNFTRYNSPASGGWYLYAAVVPEVLVVVTGFWSFAPVRWRSKVLMTVTGAFVLLDLYTIHFISIPYYIGLIRHKAGGSLPGLRIGAVTELGIQEVLARLSLNKPEALGLAMILAIWAVFLVLSIAVVFIAGLSGENDVQRP